jgi:hypothetical protein
MPHKGAMDTIYRASDPHNQVGDTENPSFNDRSACQPTFPSETMSYTITVTTTDTTNSGSSVIEEAADD